ncbi:MAG: flagellar basal body-associated FliL family protein [Spirochaetes bacterium]|nr:flagellar basal body-associated FliL family protein [Spirochaetota bacterium]
MSDNLEDSVLGDGGDVTAPTKPHGGGSFILKLLMWVGIGLALVILIVAVVLVTMSVRDTQGKPLTEVPDTEEYQKALPAYEYSTLLGELRMSTADKEPASIVVKILLGFVKGEKKVPDELNSRKYQLIDSVRMYFTEKKADELKPQYERQIKEELRERINRMLETPGVKDVLFEKFDIMQL